MNCDQCAAEIPVRNANPETGRYVCPACGAVGSSKSEPRTTAELPVDEARTAEGPGLVPPKGWQLSRRPESLTPGGNAYRQRSGSSAAELTLSWRWFSLMPYLSFLRPIYVSAVLCLVAVGFAGSFASEVLPFNPTALALALQLLLVGYCLLAALFNRTTLSLEDNLLTVHHGPIPWFGNHSLPLQEVRQIYCRKDRSVLGTLVRTADRISNNFRASKKETYEVRAQLSGGTVSLITGLLEPNQARYVEQLVETSANIVDVPVIGELRRSKRLRGDS